MNDHTLSANESSYIAFLLHEHYVITYQLFNRRGF